MASNLDVLTIQLQGVHVATWLEKQAMMSYDQARLTERN